jgi:hypothetical protein
LGVVHEYPFIRICEYLYRDYYHEYPVGGEGQGVTTRQEECHLQPD